MRTTLGCANDAIPGVSLVAISSSPVDKKEATPDESSVTSESESCLALRRVIFPHSCSVVTPILHDRVVTLFREHVSALVSRFPTRSSESLQAGFRQARLRRSRVPLTPLHVLLLSRMPEAERNPQNDPLVIVCVTLSSRSPLRCLSPSVDVDSRSPLPLLPVRRDPVQLHDPEIRQKFLDFILSFHIFLTFNESCIPA